MTSTVLPTDLLRPSPVAIRRLTGCEPGPEDHAAGSTPTVGDAGAAGHPRRTPIAAQARGRVHLMLRLILEVIDGRRPLGHLADALAEPVHGYVAAMATRTRADRTRPDHARAGRSRTESSRTGPSGSAVLRSTRLAQPRDGVLEASAVWQFSGRVRALAARFEEHHVDGSPRWRCVYLRLG